VNDTPSPAPTKAKTHLRKTDLRGASRLAISATIGLANLVENLHHNISRVPGPLGTTSQRSTAGITGLVYRSIRGVTRLVGGSLEALLGQVEALLGPGIADSSSEREAVVAALNGVLGDHLEASANPLAIEMRLVHEGVPLTLDAASLALALPSARRRVLVMLHGLCMNPRQWRSARDDGGSFDLGASLAAEGEFTPLYLHYNSGLHVSTNGRRFSELLQTLLLNWPTPLEELVIVGHSMGGLVARSAVHQAIERGDTWPRRLKAMVFLGTPHHGAPLERGGHWIDLILGASPYTSAFARLGQLRSAGITDLRHGNLLDVDWSGADRFAHGHDVRVNVPLPDGVACYAVAASLGPEQGALRAKLMGDGLVPVASALGQHRQAERCLAFPTDRQWTAQGLNHLELLASDAVLAQLRAWLMTPRQRQRAPASRRPHTPDALPQIGGSSSPD
jgi:pimeloyl-ACP methyl ester carboxylesterase